MIYKDCIHYEACKDIYYPMSTYDEEAKAFDESDSCDGCQFYSDKSRFIELPCKVGDTVYYITGIGHNLIKSAQIKEIIIDENGIKDLYVKGDGHNFENSFDIFFLTREEAENALKERERK